MTGKELGFTLVEIAGMLEDTAEDGSLKLQPELLLRQINHLEEQHRTIAAALAGLRQRYYMMREMQDGGPAEDASAASSA
jgi:DNA-binding transcriptional MerR regulator